jgi:hypothetical protein
MIDEQTIIDALDARVRRRTERREFFRIAGASATAVAGTSLLAACFGDGDDDDNGNIGVISPTPTPTPSPTSTTGAVTDADILNFALNLEYLEAQFYSFAATGSGLSSSLLGGTGTQGAVTGGRKASFSDPVVAAYANEIAGDEVAHVAFLRSQLGSAVVAQPAIDISGTDPNGAFSNAARSAGLVGAGQAFDPYANDENFLLGAFIFEDVGVTAYKGAAPLLASKAFLEASAGILAAEAYHAGLIRTVLFRKGIATPALRTSADKISDARDSLDGSTDLDQGISPMGAASNIVPADANGIAFSRTPGQVLNIAYLTRMAVTRGGFFPAGVNGKINMSAAS